MNKQNGSALILSLLILLVMTMLGITAMSTSSLEEKMAANDRNQKIAFHNAELTLTESEQALLSKKWRSKEENPEATEGANIVDLSSDIERMMEDSSNHSFYNIDEAQPNYFSRNTWGSNSCISVSDNNQSDYSACYIVEYIDDQLPLEAGGGYDQLNQANLGHKILKFTARSTDSNQVATAMVQSTVRKAYVPAP